MKLLVHIHQFLSSLPEYLMEQAVAWHHTDCTADSYVEEPALVATTQNLHTYTWSMKAEYIAGDYDRH